MTKKQDVEKQRRTETKERIRWANERLRARHAEVAKTYDGHISGNEEVAIAIVHEFANVRASAWFERGGTGVRVEPVLSPFDEDSSNFAPAEHAAENLKYWPTFEALKSFARGYSAAKAASGDAEELRRENDRLKAKLDALEDHRGPRGRFPFATFVPYPPFG